MRNWFVPLEEKPAPFVEGKSPQTKLPAWLALARRPAAKEKSPAALLSWPPGTVEYLPAPLLLSPPPTLAKSAPAATALLLPPLMIAYFAITSFCCPAKMPLDDEPASM